MKKVFLFNYKKKKFYTDISFDDVSEILVEILSGDEILTFAMKDGQTITIDSAELACDLRTEDLDRETYIITEKDFEKWNTRKDSQWWLRNNRR